MARRRNIITAILAVIIIITAAIVYLWTSLDALVAGAIEKYGSRATQTAVRVASVDIALRQGKAVIGGLVVENPKGYTSPYAFSLGDITVDIDTGSVNASPLVVEEVRVRAPQVYYEVNEARQSNLKEIKDNLPAGGGSAAQDEAADERAKKLIIRRLVIEDGRVVGRVAALDGREASAELPRIELTDLGAPNGAVPEVIARQVVEVLLERAARAAARTGVEQLTGESAEELREGLKDKAKEQMRQQGGALDRLLDR